ncbi:hypothetical protein AB0O75_45040 [Streptomyces sp. NPDC088921]|uniref:ATP-dependent DNA ligase n=1 Tax=unclassified Streptomyces TaxID=2593676 RepID=UPI003444BCF9
MEWPVEVTLARPVTQLPTGPSWAYEIKVDGHRTVLWRTEGGVRLQSRTGRDVTALWMDLAVAAMSLPPGVILDGEAVVYVAADDGTARISFAAAQSGALSIPRRAKALADQHPATYVTGVRTGSWVGTGGAIGRSRQVGDLCSRRPSRV